LPGYGDLEDERLKKLLKLRPTVLKYPKCPGPMYLFALQGLLDRKPSAFDAKIFFKLSLEYHIE
jgi:hypothetical protein